MFIYPYVIILYISMSNLVELFFSSSPSFTFWDSNIVIRYMAKIIQPALVHKVKKMLPAIQATMS